VGRSTLVVTLAGALLLSARAADAQTQDCEGHLFAIGSRLGWAQAMARSADPAQDALLFQHMTAVGAHAQAANLNCAQAPPPWPVFQNWNQLQSGLAQMIDQYQRGIIDRRQLVVNLHSWEEGMARDLAFRRLGENVYADRTCGELYLLIGAALADAQTTTQIHGRLTPEARQRLSNARSAVDVSTRINPPCREMTRLIADIDEAMRHPADNSTVTLVNDLWRMASLINRIGPPIPVVPTLQPGLNAADCEAHLWSTGSRLGAAESIARFGDGRTDMDMFEHLAVAGQHIRAANRACAQAPPPWPVWQNWQQLQGQLNQLVDMFRRGLMTRTQLANSIRALRDAIAGQLAYHNENGLVVPAQTCEALIVRIGGLLGFAQTTTQRRRVFTTEAVSALREAQQLLVLYAQLRPPCTDASNLQRLIGQILSSLPQLQAVQAVNAIWTLGSQTWQAASPSWPPDNAQPPAPAPGAVTVSGTLDASVVNAKNARLLNDFRYQASSFQASTVTLQIVPPRAPGQPSTAIITSQVSHRRHLKHPQRPGEQFEEWWTVTVTLGTGQGTVDRVEGPAEAVEEYRSVAPNRTDRRVYANERWHALRLPDGSYRLTMPGIQDGIAFILR
jgi:hypothetical protein